eukprot:TRINITY_DN12238_c2_g7_i2.p1 TRINITY_DN12238_c2_g7~~TRINITY_DN12238_c2_g7_i2.p1  ORF type:complete len:321 (+),score=51.27 TRINITY_DN12238_c2_g7_i2:409-1371(+)
MASNRSQTARRRKNSNRGQNYAVEDIEKLLDVVEQVLPVCNSDWQTVFSRWQSVKDRKTPVRDVGSIRAKYRKLVSSTKRTGDPDMPADVRRAKSIERDIEQKIMATTLSTVEPEDNHTELERTNTVDVHDEEEIENADSIAFKLPEPAPRSPEQEILDHQGEAIATLASPSTVSAKRSKLTAASTVPSSVRSKALAVAAKDTTGSRYSTVRRRRHQAQSQQPVQSMDPLTVIMMRMMDPEYQAERRAEREARERAKEKADEARQRAQDRRDDQRMMMMMMMMQGQKVSPSKAYVYHDAARRMILSTMRSVTFVSHPSLN